MASNEKRLKDRGVPASVDVLVPITNIFISTLILLSRNLVKVRHFFSLEKKYSHGKLCHHNIASKVSQFQPNNLVMSSAFWIRLKDVG